MNVERSLVSVAYELLEKNNGSIEFHDLFNQVCDILKIEDREQYISYFYTQITLDGRFVTLGGNVWDLRSRYKFDDINNLHEFDYEDDEEENEDDIDEDEDELDKDPDEDSDEDSDDEDQDSYEREDY